MKHISKTYLKFSVLFVLCIAPIVCICGTEDDSLTTASSRSSAIVYIHPTNTHHISVDNSPTESTLPLVDVKNNRMAFIKTLLKYKNDIISAFMFVMILICIIVKVIYKLVLTKGGETDSKITSFIGKWTIIFCIIFICVFSNSSWAYLALVVLCILLLDKYVPGLLTEFSKAAAAIQGKTLNITSATQGEISQKRKQEVTENIPEERSNRPSMSFGGERSHELLASNVHVVDQQFKEYTQIEQFALNFLGKRYPSLQGLVKLRISGQERIVLDGLVQQKNKNVIIEIKYCRNENQVKRYQLQELFKAAEFISRKTAKLTEVLLFIVVENEDIKAKLEHIYNQIPEGTNLIIEVHTKEDISI